jgi:hypothetical protein
MTSAADFKKVSKDVRASVERLIWLSEIYFVMAELQGKPVSLPGWPTFHVMQRAVGYELVARLFRLLEADTKRNLSSEKNIHIGRLSKMLSDDALLQAFARSRKNLGREFLTTLRRERTKIASKLAALQKSRAFVRVQVFRHRFVGHRITRPGMLDNPVPRPRYANAQKLHPKELRWLIAEVGELCERIAALEGSKDFQFLVIANEALRGAKEFWKRPISAPLSFLDNENEE